MLQRSPSYIIALPSAGPAGRRGLRRLLPERLATTVVRWKNVLLSRSRSSSSAGVAPGPLARRLLRAGRAGRLPPGYPVDTHFRPAYDPWDQRLCLVPDGDLFAAISAGSVTMVTDTIDTFTETGVRLASGAELDADIVVTATGLSLLAARRDDAAGGRRPSRHGRDRRRTRA